MHASIVIRTYNEEQRLPQVLAALAAQEGVERETVLVDSGSTDRTVEIAQGQGCRIERIAKDQFSFGRLLNLGCRSACGQYLLFVSGHCIPVGTSWLARLLQPLIEGRVALAYGRQIGGESSRFSQCRIFENYFPAQSRIPQDGFFCNNANAAMPRQLWERNPFDEDLTGLEDMHLGKRLAGMGQAIGYVAEAAGIVLYRLMQYWGAYRGNHVHRRLSRDRKERYFYPR